MRGKHATKPIEEVLAEARELAADGVRELNIVAQDTTYYGLDLYGRPRLAELLGELDQIEGLDWIRLMYLYPMYFGDELIDVLAAATKIVPYLDMPLQHINDTMLRRMQRRVNRAQTEELLGKAARADSRIWCCGPRSSPAFRARPTSNSASWSSSSGSSSSSGWACSPIRSSPTRRRPGCPIICRRR